MRAERHLLCRLRRAELGRRLFARPDRADADVLVAEVRHPVGERSRRENDRRSSAASASWSSSYCRSPRSGRPTSSQSRRKNFGSRAPTVRWRAVGGRVEAVAGEPAGEHARSRLAHQPMRDEVVRAVCHRDDEARALSRARALEERGEHLRDCAERSGRKVGDLDRRQPGCGVLEHAGPAEVVDVVPGALFVASVQPEPGDRAVDGGVWDVARSRRRADRRRPAGNPRARRRRARRAPARRRRRRGGRRRRTRCRHEGPCPTRSPSAASGPLAVAPPGRRAHRGESARGSRTRPGGSA